MKKFKKDEIWTYYQHLERMKKQNLHVKYYCNDNNLDYGSFRNFKTIFQYHGMKNKHKYNKYGLLYSQYLLQEDSMVSFCRNKGLKEDFLTVFARHKKYHEIVDEFIKIGHPVLIFEEEKQDTIINKPENEEMKFIAISSAENTETMCQPEIFHEQNIVEISISKGIKVIVSPEVPPAKLIKIIELLKEI